MTCAEARDALMSLEVSAFGTLDHLDQCAACRSFADEIRAADQAMVQQVEAFAVAGSFDVDWQQATARARKPRRQPLRYAVLPLVALAAAALVWVALPDPDPWQVLPPIDLAPSPAAADPEPSTPAPAVLPSPRPPRAAPSRPPSPDPMRPTPRPQPRPAVAEPLPSPSVTPVAAPAPAAVGPLVVEHPQEFDGKLRVQCDEGPRAVVTVAGGSRVESVDSSCVIEVPSDGLVVRIGANARWSLERRAETLVLRPLP